MEVLIYPLAFIVLLGILVVVHEYGHYAVARLSGVQILRFSVGFGRPIWMRVDKRGTEFVLALIPFGGYLRMLDDRDPEQAKLQVAGRMAYMDLHPKWRIAIALGGAFANFVLAVFVFGLLQFVGSYQPVPMTAPPQPDSLLGQAGLMHGGAIEEVDGRRATSWESVGLALTERLGDSGEIAVTVRSVTDGTASVISVPIQRWHEGDRDPDVIRSIGLQPSLLAVIGQVVPDTPAARAGLKADDVIVEAGGSVINRWSDLVEVIEQHPNQPLTLVYMRSGVKLQTTAVPGARQVTDPQSGTQTERGFLGVGSATQYVSVNLWQALPASIEETWHKAGLILGILKKMITGHVSVKNLAGPISIAQVAGDSAQYGWRQFFGILAFLSISLGVLNLLPIPVLDGGHVIFSTVEWLRGKPVPEHVQIWGVQIGIVLVGALMILSTYNDILRLF